MIARYSIRTRSAIPQLLVTVPPNAEPLGVQDYLNYSNLKLKIQQYTLAEKLVAAREAIENWTGCALITRSVDQICDYDPTNNPTGIPLYMTGAVGEIDLRSPPLRKITQVIVYDPFRAVTLVDTDVYRTLPIIDPWTKLIVNLGHVWPGILSDIQSIQISCIAGYSTPITAVDTSGDTLTAIGNPYQVGDIFRLTGAFGGQTITPTAPGGLVFRSNYYVVTAGDVLQISSTPNGSPIDITDAGQGMLFAGEIPSQFLRAIMITATNDFLQEEYDKTGEEDIGIPKAAKDIVKRYKRNWM